MAILDFKQINELQTRLGGLYSSTLESFKSSDLESEWKLLAHQMILDIGASLDVWRAELDKASGKIIDGDAEEAIRIRIESLNARFDKIHEKYNIWMSPVRCGRILYLCEKSWMRLLEWIIAEALVSSELLTPVFESSAIRLRKVQDFYFRLKKSSVEQDHSYAIPVLLTGSDD